MSGSHLNNIMCPGMKEFIRRKYVLLYYATCNSSQGSTVLVPTDEVNSMGSLTALLGAVFELTLNQVCFKQ